ncbi:MAG: TylF/MycF/NovP-related O-methyltransferase [Phycisphaerales bacterium]|nr:TylF/MycF/NovP-related O-methyltransferase [Phycisphaerales bacterium]
MKKIKYLISKSIHKLRGKDRFPPDFTEGDREIIRAVQPYTKTSRERILAMIRSVQYITHCAIPGAIVECGVYKGGSMMAAARTLLDLHCQNRDLYLFDTFEGMGQPTEEDINIKGLIAVNERPNRTEWSRCPLETVQEAFKKTAYDPNRIHYVKGMVEDTVPDDAPGQIALLRLDTDWYESTRHELEHLYPRLVSGGILIIDDYGHWEGARKATDEYIKMHQLRLFLNRIDYTGRLAVKP